MLKLLPDILVKRPETEVINYDLKEKKRFVDFTHDGLGRMCKVCYDPKKKQYEFEPV